MFRRYKFGLLFSMLLLVLAGPVLAEPAQAAADGSVYLYNGVQQELVRVNLLDGSTESFSLGLGDAVYVAGWTMGFAPDGSVVAFCADDPSSSGESFHSTLYVRDIAAGTDLMTVELGATIGCRVGSHGFSADGSRVAVGVVDRIPASVEETGEGAPLWQLAVYDVATGTPVNVLDADSAAAAGANLPVAMPVMPEVLAVEASTVTFVATPYGVGGAAYNDVYRWDMNTGALELLYSGPRSNASLSDRLPASGETVWLDYDANRAVVEIPNTGPVGQFNVVKILDASGSERVIYHTGEAILGSPTFINGGQQLAFMLHTPQGPEDPYLSRWVALDRNGTISELIPDAGFVNVVNAPGGYVAFDRTFDASGQSTFVLRHRDLTSGSDADVLWSATAEGWELVWVSLAPLNSELAPFPAAG